MNRKLALILVLSILGCGLAACSFTVDVPESVPLLGGKTYQVEVTGDVSNPHFAMQVVSPTVTLSPTVSISPTIPVTPTVTQDVSILNEGKYTPTTVPYASLVSTWLDLTKRNPQLMLCLDPKGCVVAARGDYRTYVYEDKTPIPEDVLRTWIVSQVGYFPHAKSLVDHKGVVIWP